MTSARDRAKPAGGVPRQTGDEVHIHLKVPGGPDLAVGPADIGGGVGAGHCFENGIVHGLGVHRDPVYPVAGEDGELFGGDGVGPARLHRPF